MKSCAGLGWRGRGARCERWAGALEEPGGRRYELTHAQALESGPVERDGIAVEHERLDERLRRLEAAAGKRHRAPTCRRAARMVAQLENGRDVIRAVEMCLTVEPSGGSKGERLGSRGCYRAGTAKRTIAINLVVFVMTNDAEVTKRDRRGRPKCLSSISLGTTHPVSPRQVATHCEAQALLVQPPLTSCRPCSSGGGCAWGARGCGEPPRNARAQPWSGWPRRCSSTPCGRAWGARRLWRLGKGGGCWVSLSGPERVCVRSGRGETIAT